MTKDKDQIKKDTLTAFIDMMEMLITSFIWALLFITFVIRTFHIPTGSMADTLKGAHFRLRCEQCGYLYERNSAQPTADRDLRKLTQARQVTTRCPSCGNYQRTQDRSKLISGDKILVLKCIYQFFEPKHWDVVVFKNPLNPRINFIKRLVGKPGETVEIIDGDVYIDGRISRKPEKVQDELWMPVYNNDYQPVDPFDGFFNGRHIWRHPFETERTAWNHDPENPTALMLNIADNKIHFLEYDTSKGNDFRCAYAYNPTRHYKDMPICSDLMIRFFASFNEQQGIAGASLSKYRTRYIAQINAAGQMTIQSQSSEGTELLAEKTIAPVKDSNPVLLKFANVDHQLVFEFGKEKLIHDLGTAPDAAGPRITNIMPEVRILGSGQVRLTHVALYRDIHYTSQNIYNNDQGTATQGNPITLAEDEFLVFGDNSPASHDSRWWDQTGIGNNEKTYRQGIVPRDYLVGKAFFVIWPGGYKPYIKFPFGIIPDTQRMGFITSG